jgi:hypothetical protein
MNFRAQLFLAVALLGLLNADASGHGGTYVAPGAENIARPLAVLLGTNWNFTATAHCRMDDHHHPDEFLEWQMHVAARHGQLRCELDISTVTGQPPPLPAGERQRLRAWKVARTASVLRPHAPTDLLLYPDVQAYVEFVRGDEDGRRHKARRTVKRRDVGNEHIETQPCVQRQVTIRFEGVAGAAEFTTWESTQHPHFPLQVRFPTEDGTVTIRFDDVRFESPPAARFEPPAGFGRFDSVMELHRAAGQPHRPASD